MSIIETAKLIAQKAHEGALRKWVVTSEYPNGVPYFTHPTRIAARVEKLESANSVMIAAAWLHDVVEDTNLPHEEIIDGCGIPTYLLVLELTNPSKQLKKATRSIKKEVDRLHIQRGSNEAKLIKLVDRTDNLLESVTAPESFRRKYIPESIELFKVLQPLMEITTPSINQDASQLCHEFTDALKKIQELTPQ